MVDKKLRLIGLIFPECEVEMASTVSSIDEYSRTFEMLTGKQLADPMPEYISDENIRELNLMANRIENSINSLCNCKTKKL